MIRIYCQYSYGGYKTLHIKGIENESLGYDSEVTLETPHDFPSSAHVFFQFGGSKMVYRKLDNGDLTLVVREIPSDDVDGAGRPICCAVQFICPVEDRQTLNILALRIANNVIGFGNFFAKLFYVRQGLHIEGDKLRTYIDRVDTEVFPREDAPSVFRSFWKKQEGVFLFVPLSENFGKDKDVTNRVCEELKIKKEELKGSIISLSELMACQNQIMSTSVHEKKTADTMASEKDKTQDDFNQTGSKKGTDEQIQKTDWDKRISYLEDELSAIKPKIQQLFYSNSENQKAIKNITTNKKEEEQMLSNQINVCRKVGYCLLTIIVVLLFITLIKYCHNKEGKGMATDQQRTEQVFNEN